MYESNWLQDNLALAYPFKERPECTQSIDIASLCADALIVYRGDTPCTVALSEIFYSEPNSSFLFTFTVNGVIAESLITIENLDEWITTVHNLEPLDEPSVSITLIFAQAFASAFADNQSAVFIGAEFVPRCHNVLPARVSTVKRYIGDDNPIGTDPMVTTKNGVVFAEGFNVDIKDAAGAKVIELPFGREITTRDPKTIVISAGPGLGRGQKPSVCDGAEYVYSVNQVTPTKDGRLILNTDNCLSAKKSSAESLLLIGNKCEPCCECTDYVAVYEAMRKLVAMGNATKSDLDDALDGITEIMAAFGSDGPQVKQLVKLFPRNGWVMSVQGTLFNSTGQTMEGITLTFDFESEATFIVVPGSGYLNCDIKKNFMIDPTKNNNSVSVGLGGINLRSGKTMIYSFELYFTGGVRSHNTVVAVSMTPTCTNIFGIGGTAAVANLRGHYNL